MPLTDCCFDLIRGLIGGGWANCYLFMIEIVMAIRFFSRFQDEHLWLKCVVSLTLTVDLISAINHFACAYMYMILHWGNDTFLQNQYWPFPVYLITIGLSGFIVQQFLLLRFCSLTKSWIVTLCLSFISLTALGGAIATAVLVVQQPNFEERQAVKAVKVPAMIWLVASSVANICITSTLIFAKLKTPSKKMQR
ncbi:hypothetical protein L218DRAFT_877636 [Marasmius fiardii PR-910]|nr:hypothetical protein L218DRAFT_877636 [Marasmius fiardii PR-910]